MNDVFDRALAPILRDPITIGLLVLLVIALIVASVAGRRAQAAERVRKRLEYVADTSARDDDAVAQRLALDFGDDSENPPVLARFLGLISPLAANSFKSPAVTAGASSYSPNALGRPAFG